MESGDRVKKWRYSSGIKAAVIIAHQCLAIVLVLCVTVLLVLYMENIFNFSEKRNTSYQDTEYFTDQFESTAVDILNFIEFRKKFETNGVYDPDKLIDIWQYYENEDIPQDAIQNKTSNKLAYRLGDLVDWSKGYSTQTLEIVSECYIENGIQQKLNIYRDEESVFSEEKTVDSLRDLSPEIRDEIIEEIEYHYGGSYSLSGTEKNWAVVSNADEEEEAEYEGAEYEENEQMPEVIRKVVSGKLFDLQKDELEWLLDELDMGQNMSTTSCNAVIEDYLPAEGAGIWDMFLKGDCSLEYMQGAYQALEFTLDDIRDGVSRYRKGVNNYNQQERSANVYYWVIRGRERGIYTNIDDSNGLDLSDFGKKLGKYILYRESDAHLETNVKDMNEYFYNAIEPPYVNKESVIFVGVDTAFPYEDGFLEAKREYSMMHPWIKVGLWGAVASFLLELICLIYLSIVAGKRDDSGEVYLNFLDKIPAELLFVPTAADVIFLIYGIVYAWSVYDGGRFIGTMLISGIITFLGMGFLLIFYLSFVRRIRADVLWRHSILRWFIHGIGQLFVSRKSVTKMLIWFGLHLVACTIILPMISVSYYSGGLFLAGAGLFALLCGVEAVLIIREGIQRNKVMEGISRIAGGDLEYKIEEKELKGDNKKLAQAVNTIGEGLYRAADESMKNERLQADLITNVSHDIKTPLTSIVNYVDLLKREDLQNERAQSYIAVLDKKSQRLKQLAEDLVEASRISSGNINLNMERINLVELIHQTEGEFAERFAERELKVISNIPSESVVILADGRRIWRVLENLYTNVAKYAMKQTRVYTDLEADGENVSFSIKNISENPLNIEADELTERFIRGDVSRSTEGSGLGLSIAQNLTTLMGGTFQIYLDGDLFKVMISFHQE